MEDKITNNQPWVTCFLTNLLITFMEEQAAQGKSIDYADLFRDLEAFEAPPRPELFLKDVDNWVPLTVLRGLLWQCEGISGRKDVAYHAARSYFEPEKKRPPSVFGIIVRLLNDVRSMLMSVNSWAAVQTNYLRLQPFERPGAAQSLYLLAQFHEAAKPTIGTLYLTRGLCEGIPRLYPFLEEMRCVEEISQIGLEDIVGEFPDYGLFVEGDRLFIEQRMSKETIAEAIKIPLRAETIVVSQDYTANMPLAVVPVQGGQMNVFTHIEEEEPVDGTRSPKAWKVVRGGTLRRQSLSYSLDEGQVYNAPYCRFRLIHRENRAARRDLTPEEMQREVSHLLYGYMDQVKQTQLRLVEANLERGRLTLENIQLRREIDREYNFAGIVGRAEKMENLFRTVRSLAETDVSVIIEGETGTGKELIARAIHYNSARKQRRFVPVNCGALSETLLESELFGHEKGAFTGAITQRKGIFEVADGGTLFLDEIGEISPSTQVKLLRVLQEGELQRVGGSTPIRVDVRVVAATNQNLVELVRKNRFRQDLYYRLNVFLIRVPPLRERIEDIPLLIAHFIEKRRGEVHKQVTGVTPAAMASLIAYGWPGNVRELENVIQRMMVVCGAGILDVQDLPPEISALNREAAERPKDLKGMARESAEIMAKRVIADALSKTSGNVTKAAEVLGISRATLQNKMKIFGLRSPKK